MVQKLKLIEIVGSRLHTDSRVVRLFREKLFRCHAGGAENGMERSFGHIARMVRNRRAVPRGGIPPNLVAAFRVSIEFKS